MPETNLSLSEVLWILLFIALFLGAINILTYFFQHWFIFRPRKLPPDHHFNLEAEFEELIFQTPGSGTINALFFRQKEDNRPVILYSHGNSGSLEEWADVAIPLYKKGYNVLMWDYRKFGKSTGAWKEHYFYSDIHHLFRYLLDSFERKKIIVFGRSMGTGPSCWLAAREKVAGLILETPYSSIPDLFYSYYPFLFRSYIFRFVFPNKKWLRKVKCRIIAFHGTRDLVVPLRCARKIKPSLKTGDKFVVIQGGDHINLSTSDIYQQELDEFLDKI